MENNSDRISIAGLDPGTLESLLSASGIDRKYAVRILYWVYRRHIKSFTEMDDIPADVRRVLDNRFTPGIAEPVASSASGDGSVKYLFRNSGGLTYEAVWLPDGKRRTICLSVQSGCRMHCSFCATGRMGWLGDLTAGEIVGQMLSLPEVPTHVVMMGMGEPGDNIDEVIRACNILTAEWGLAAGRNRITISTVGVTPSLKRLLEETRCNITLSLHSPFAGERATVIAAEKRWPFREALEMMRSADTSGKRRFSVAYVMIEGINDTSRHLEGLISLLQGTGIRVNLLPYHPVDGNSWKSSSRETMMAFKHSLVTSGIMASVRLSRGADIDAACGMLAARTARQETTVREG